jgi:hypothetical protein
MRTVRRNGIWSKFWKAARAVAVEFWMRSLSCEYWLSQSQPQPEHVSEEVTRNPNERSTVFSDPYGLISRWRLVYESGYRE